MAETERKYSGNLTLGGLELALEAHEQLFGELIKLEALAANTVATYDDSNFPPLHTLALIPRGFNAGGSKLFEGQAVITGVPIELDVYRTE